MKNKTLSNFIMDYVSTTKNPLITVKDITLNYAVSLGLQCNSKIEFDIGCQCLYNDIIKFTPLCAKVGFACRAPGNRD